MVKIRLARLGNKHRPFYRVVVQKSTAGRNSKAIEILGTYDPLTKPSTVKLDSERAMHWLLEGAQPTETAARLLKREGILADFFAKRPSAEKKFGFLDKTTAAMSKESVLAAPTEAKAEAKAEVKAEVQEEVKEEAAADVAVAEEAPSE